MRRMIPIFNDVGHKVPIPLPSFFPSFETGRSHAAPQLQTAIESRVPSDGAFAELDMLTWMARTALELIGQAGLGYSFDPLVADKPDDFAVAVKAFSCVVPLFSPQRPLTIVLLLLLAGPRS